MHPKVNVIISTYNGEEYLREQLDSLVAQTYPNIDVWIRDDGSSDQTIAYCMEYEGLHLKNIRFHLIKDSLGNLGYGRSFFHAILQAEDADYYAFCDQDDVWEPDKLSRAVEFLSGQPAETPFLYSSGYWICDCCLNKIGRDNCITLQEMSIGKAIYIYDNMGLGPGFSFVFNRALKELAYRKGYEDIFAHDVWLWMIVSAGLSGYHYDGTPMAKYRRHGNTASISEKGHGQVWADRIRRILKGSWYDTVMSVIQTFWILYGTKDMSEENRIFIETFRKKNSIRTTLKKIRFPYRLKKKLHEEVLLRVAFLLGRA